MIHPSRDHQECCTVINVKIRRDLLCLSLCCWKKAAVLSLLLSVFRAKWDASGSLGQKCLCLWDWGELAGSLLHPWKGSRLRGTFYSFKWKWKSHTTQSKCLSSPLLYLKAITSKLCVTMKTTVSAMRLLEPKIIQFFCGSTTEKMSKGFFKRPKGNCLPICLFTLLSVMRCHDFCCSTVADLMLV